MALTADEKENIMASRGQSATPVAKSLTRKYELRFADGKAATMLDMQAEPVDELVRSVTGMFKPGYLVSMELL